MLTICHSNSCKNSAARALLLRASKPALVLTVPPVEMEAMLGLGRAARPADLLLGVPATTTATMKAVPLAALRLGLATVVTAIGIVATVMAGATEATATTLAAKVVDMAALLRLRAPRLGISPWLLRPDTVDTQATGLTGLLALLRAWVLLLLGCRPLLLLVVRRLAFLAGLTLSSSNTPMPSRRRRRPRLATLLRRRRPWTCLLLRRALRWLRGTNSTAQSVLRSGSATD
jgi:hypothetical protein